MRTSVLIRLLGVTSVFAALWPSTVRAADVRRGDRVRIPAGTTISEDLYVFAREVIIEGDVEGDLVIAASSITVRGRVDGNVIAAGNRVLIEGAVERSARVAGADVSIRNSVGKDLVAACGSCTLEKAGSVGADALIAGGTLDIAGDIGRNLKAAGDEVRLSGITREEAQVRGRKLYVASSARISTLLHGTREAPDISGDAQIAHREARPAWVMPDTAPNPIWGLLFASLLALVTGGAIMWLWPERARDAARTIERRPGGSLAWGIGLAIIVPVLIVVGLVTLVGIPIALLTAAFYGFGLYFGYLAFSHLLGTLLLERLRQPAHPFIAFATGVVIMLIVSLLPVIGPLASVLATLTGFGGLWLMVQESTWYSRHFRRAAPTSPEPPGIRPSPRPHLP